MSEQVAGFDPHKDAEHWDTLPIISLAGWFDGTAEDKAAVAAELRKAAMGCGFFYLTDHGIDQALIDAVYGVSKAFHGQPEDYKEQYNIAKTLHHRGWVSKAETLSYEKDDKVFHNYHEAFDLSYELPEGDPRIDEGYGLNGRNVWPDLPGFKETVSEYYTAVYELGRELMAAFELSLGLEPGTFLKHVTFPTSQLRLLKYYENDAPADEENVGIGAHSDFECFTILNTSGPGLQVLSAADHWVEAPPIEGAYVVNIGDCLEAWTGGLFKATQHRVINLGKERYSLPLFFAADYDTEIKPLPQFTSEESLERYPAFKAGEHLYGRTIYAFPYLKKMYDAGELVVGFDIPEENPFKRISVEERAIETPASTKGS